MLLSIENFVLISKYQIYDEKQIEIQALITEIGVFTITTLFMGFAEPINIKETQKKILSYAIIILFSSLVAFNIVCLITFNVNTCRRIRK